MSETRRLGYLTGHGIYATREGGVGTDRVHEPTDAERVELAIAALTHGTDREVLTHTVDPDLYSERSANDWLERAIRALAFAGASLARDAAAKERERAEEAEVERLADALQKAALGPERYPEGNHDGWHYAARRAYEMGARAPQGEEAGR